MSLALRLSLIFEPFPLVKTLKLLDDIKSPGLAFYLLALPIHVFPACGQSIPRNSTQPGATPGPAFEGYLKAVLTGLAIVSAAAITITYSLLIRAGTRLSTVSKLPLRAIETNLSHLLSATWPSTSYNDDCTGQVETIRLFCVGRTGQHDEIQQRKARGAEECPVPPAESMEKNPLWLTSGSSLTRNVVQIAVWESITLWLALIMFFSSLLYNGILDDSPGPDAYPRLVVVAIYLVAYVFHLIFVWRYVTRFFTLVAGGAAWSMLHRARFAVVDRDQLQRYLVDRSSELYFREIDRANSAVYIGLYHARLARELPTPATRMEQEPEKSKELRDATASIESVAKVERDSATTSSIEALARVETNAATVTAITIAYGFAVWTSRLEGTDSSTLGSLALLASLSIGVGSMYTSAVSLSLLNNSFETICRLKEIKINGLAVDHVSKRKWTKNAVGFFLKAAKASRPATKSCGVGILDMFAAAKLQTWFKILIFGPACVLLPSKRDVDRQSEDTSLEFKFDVREHKITFTTTTTKTESSQEKHADLEEAIHVCYTPTLQDV